MIKIKPQELQILRAKNLAKKIPKLKNSIRKGKGNHIGVLGEILVADYFGWDMNETYDYDITTKHGKIDVKTKACGSEPQPHYYCSVAEYNIRQKCDVYVFVRIKKDFSMAWILRWIPKDQFFAKAEKKYKGQFDPTSPPHCKFYFKANCYNLPIEKLYKIDKNLSKGKKKV